MKSSMILKYGDHSCSLDSVPGNLLATILPRAPLLAAAAAELVAGALESCEELFSSWKAGDRVVIVTSDITRHTGSEIYLPLLVDRLNRIGIPDRNITILIALGIHRKQTEGEHRKILGPLFGRIRVVDHDCDDPAGLVFLGNTRNGIPVEINRLAAEADRLILTGTVGFHYFAGFGGGRKAVLPGISSRRACMASHFAVLNPGEGSGKNPAATTGVLEGNPVHGAMLEACALAKPDLLLNTVVSAGKEILAVFAGDWRSAHADACRFYGDRFSFPLDELADLVIVSCGGYPKDINVIQAHKSMEYASRAIRDGGVMVLLAECRDGYGHPTFFDWFRYRDLAEFEAALRKRYEINGQTAYSLLQKAQKFRIVLVSALPDHEVEEMGMIPAPSLQKALDLAGGLLPAGHTTYVIPEGGAVLPVSR